MLEQPRLIKILRNDSWAAPATGAFLAISLYTLIAQIVNWVAGMELSIISDYLMIAGVTCVISSLVVLYRTRYIRSIFENGIEVKASVVSKKVHRADLKLTLKYDFLGQPREKVLDQVITERTKHFLEEKEVVLVVDQYNPSRILLKGVYA